MKRYWLMAGNWYYPNSHMGDFQGDFASEEEALKPVLTKDYEGSWYDYPFEWATIVDTQEGKIRRWSYEYNDSAGPELLDWEPLKGALTCKTSPESNT